MTRSTPRRAAAVLAAAAALALAGCSAGQVTETARKVPTVAGANATSEIGTGEVSVRDVHVIYGSVKGYLKGGTAPVGGAAFNDTPDPVTVTVTVDPVPTGTGGGQTVTASGVQLASGKLTAASEPAGHGASASAHASAGEHAPAEGAAATATATATPGTREPSPATTPGSTPGPTATAAGGTRPATPGATFPLAPWGSLSLGATQGRYLQLTGLAGALKGGMSVPLRFTFSNGVVLTVQAPVGSPLAPLPRETAHGESPAH